ncbi:MAG: TetR/AcrR family transcriptional regulator [Actinomycetota bacterium]|nr:TetR/AcrR family transcriptional regulator [Actinomycetota bacterium]
MSATTKRPRLNRDRIVDGALLLADDVGMDAFTIRRLASALGVGPMTIYHYFPNKEAIIDAMVDAVYAQIALPPTDEEWTDAIRLRCVSAREVLNRHPWAPPYMVSRTSPGPATLRHHDALLDCLRRSGLSLEMTAHAYAILDSFLHGFTLEEASLPATGDEGIQGIAEKMTAAFDAERYPSLYGFATKHVMQPGYSFGASFEFGLDLIIDGLSTVSERSA